MKQSSTSYVHVSSHGNFGTSCSVVLDYQMLRLNQVWQGSLIGGNKLAALSTPFSFNCFLLLVITRFCVNKFQ